MRDNYERELESAPLRKGSHDNNNEQDYEDDITSMRQT